MRAAMKLAIGALCAVAAAAAFIALRPLSIPSTGYFDQQSSTALSGLGSDEERFYVGLAQLEVKPGDSVQLTGLDGLPSTATPVFARLSETSAAIGVLQEKLMDHIEAYKPLAGATLTARDGPFQVLAVLPAASTDVVLSGLLLRFSVNGQPVESERLLVNVLICSRQIHADGQCAPPNPPKA
jgi:hypothetical protein